MISKDFGWHICPIFTCDLLCHVTPQSEIFERCQHADLGVLRLQKQELHQTLPSTNYSAHKIQLKLMNYLQLQAMCKKKKVCVPINLIYKIRP